MTSTVRIHHGTQLIGIESLRGIAALMVMLFHVAELLKLAPPAYLGFVSTHFGNGVPFFYALSGFVLAYGYADRLERRAQLLDFYIRRLFRIAPLFYFMVVVWMVLGWFVWQKVYTWRTVFLDVTFLFGLVPGEHGNVSLDRGSGDRPGAPGRRPRRENLRGPGCAEGKRRRRRESGFQRMYAHRFHACEGMTPSSLYSVQQQKLSLAPLPPGSDTLPARTGSRSM